MARNYATQPTAIWRQEGAFAGLSVDAQWAYWMLTSQPDISAAGVLSINLRRWTRRATDSHRDRLVSALKELGDARFVVYDQDTEELWAATFIEWDGGYNNRKRQPVIRAATSEVESRVIRDAIVAELHRIGFLMDGLPEAASDSLSSPADTPCDGASRTRPDDPGEGSPGRVGESSDHDEFSQDNRLSGSPSDGEPRSDRVVVKEVVPEVATRNPRTSTPPPSSGGVGGSARPKRVRSDRGTRLPEDWQPSEDLLAWFREKKLGDVKLSAIVDLETQTETFRNYWHAKSGKDATKVDWPATWRNWMLNAANNYGRNGARASPSGSRTSGENRHVDELPPEERKARNPFNSAVRSSQARSAS